MSIYSHTLGFRQNASLASAAELRTARVSAAGSNPVCCGFEFTPV